jgi:hypothetical protein
MNQLTFDVLSPAIGDCHPAAGVAGLLLALEALPPDQTLLTWERDRYSVTVSFQDGPKAWDYLIRQTFQLRDGIIHLPGTNAPPLIHRSLTDTLLQVPATRPLADPGQGVTTLPSKYGSVYCAILLLKSFVHQSFANSLFKGKKQKMVERVEVTSWLIPNCPASVEGFYVSPKVAIAALFSPLTWGVYRIQEIVGSGSGQKMRYSTALVCPIINTLDRLDFLKPTTPEEWVSGSLADACLHFASLNGCPAHGYQYHSKAANRPAKVIAALNCEPLAEYGELYKNFPNFGRLKDYGTAFISANPIRGLAAANLARGLTWHDGIADLGFDTLRSQKSALSEQLGTNRQAKWKERTEFESRDRRRGYKAGFNACKRGKALPESLPDSEWAEGYKQGWEAANNRDD